MVSRHQCLLPIIWIAVALWHVVHAVPYSNYILAPSSRTIYPESIYDSNGSITGAASLLLNSAGQACFNGVSSLTFDYGKNIAGIVSVTVASSSSPSARLGLTFSESSLWITSQYSDATNNGVDEILWLNVADRPDVYSADEAHTRGGFRYLTLINDSNATIEVTNVTVAFDAAPMQDLRAYTGFFHCNDDLLNRIWYAGAYTNQLCTIDPRHGDSLGGVLQSDGTSTWFNDHIITNGGSCLVDGAKRDRVVWPGDMAISLPSIFVSTNDLTSVKNSLNSLLVNQAPSGMFPYSGTPINGAASFTYHLHTLIGIDLYFQYSGDGAYLKRVWARYVRGVSWSLSFIDASGLMYVTSDADWLRKGMGGHNIEANAMLYFVLNRGLSLAMVVNDAAVSSSWSSAAAKIKTAANSLLWNPLLGLYTDNETTTLAPQDGNCWAVKSNLTRNDIQNRAISAALRSRWGPYGAPAPEAGDTVSPFVSGVEIEAHFLAGNVVHALGLMRLQWGYMLNDPRMTNSSFIEGYSMDGSLHYPPYDNDYRVSHAHGWSTAPTSLLSFYVAGFQLTSAGGATWSIHPRAGSLTSVEAGFNTSLGAFTVSFYTSMADGIITRMSFSAPNGTTGDVYLPGSFGILRSASGAIVRLENGMASGLVGDDWQLEIDTDSWKDDL